MSTTPPYIIDPELEPLGSSTEHNHAVHPSHPTYVNARAREAEAVRIPKERSIGKRVIRGFGLFLGIAVLGGGILFFLVHTGRFSPIQFSLGNTGSVQIMNFSGRAIKATLLPDGDKNSGETVRIEDGDVFSFSSLRLVGVHTLRFNDHDQLCSFTAEAMRPIRFVVVPEGIAVFQEGRNVASAAELRIETSPVCTTL